MGFGDFLSGLAGGYSDSPWTKAKLDAQEKKRKQEEEQKRLMGVQEFYKKLGYDMPVSEGMTANDLATGLGLMKESQKQKKAEEENITKMGDLMSIMSADESIPPALKEQIMYAANNGNFSYKDYMDLGKEQRQNERDKIKDEQWAKLFGLRQQAQENQNKKTQYSVNKPYYKASGGGGKGGRKSRSSGHGQFSGGSFSLPPLPKFNGNI